jgi:hypothetical protein
MTAVPMVITMLAIATMAHAESPALNTQTGKEIGLSLSYYQYQEPGVMSLTGMKMGLDLRATKALQNEQFIRGELRYAFGTVDYNSNSTGSANGEPDLYVEIRGLAGRDWQANAAVFSPYTGLGYRFLFDDSRGISTTGAAGYRRESNYLYLPIGIIHRMGIKGQARLESTLEYDHLLLGMQTSRLSDTGLGYSDVTNRQNSGYGFKLSVMYQKNNWAIGPYAQYWNIGQSDTAIFYKNGIPAIGWEPQNNTVEFGLRATQKF